jgi:asparagine synthase (glutamine-hydrolysing)
VQLIRQRCTEAVARRINGDERIGLFLSGGLDSSAVALWLKDAGRAPTLSASISARRASRRIRAREVRRCVVDSARIRAGRRRGPAAGPCGPRLAPRLASWRSGHGRNTCWERPRAPAGLDCIFNGEGGDQLFGGWTQKPMIGAEALRQPVRRRFARRVLPAQLWRFYGAEEDLYTPDFHARIGPAGQRRALADAVSARRESEHVPAASAPRQTSR